MFINKQAAAADGRFFVALRLTFLMQNATICSQNRKISSLKFADIRASRQLPRLNFLERGGKSGHLSALLSEMFGMRAG